MHNVVLDNSSMIYSHQCAELKVGSVWLLAMCTLDGRKSHSCPVPASRGRFPLFGLLVDAGIGIKILNMLKANHQDPLLLLLALRVFSSLEGKPGLEAEDKGSHYAQYPVSIGY